VNALPTGYFQATGSSHGLCHASIDGPPVVAAIHRYRRLMADTRVPGDGADRAAVWQKVANLDAGELQELLVLIEMVERSAAAELSGEGTLTVAAATESTIAQHLPAIVQSVTATFSTSWAVEAFPREVQTDGTPAASGTASGATTWTGTASGYAPPIQSEAVKSVWEAIKPASATDAVGYLQELRKWLLIILFIVIGGAGTSDVFEALEKAFTSGR